MHLDIYMQELRYEEITQQKAYDIIQLLGLFIMTFIGTTPVLHDTNANN